MSIGYEAELSWMVSRREKYFSPARILSLHHPACGLVTVVT